MLGVLMILATVAARHASRRLVSGPILNLSKAVSEVSAAEDPSARVTTRPNGAIGLLVDNINELLTRTAERVEEREQRFKKQEQHFEQWERGESARLEIEVVARTRKLRDSNEQLEAAVAEAVAENQAQTRFIANMIHEIRTPMNGVLGMTELLFNTDLTPQQLQYTRAVLGSGEDLLAIVNNILDFSKIESGKLERVDNRPFSPKGCVERVSELLVARASLIGLTLSHECGDDVPEALLGDGKRLRQVLTNMIGNAIKFTEHGTIRCADHPRGAGRHREHDSFRGRRHRHRNSQSPTRARLRRVFAGRLIDRPSVSGYGTWVGDLEAPGRAHGRRGWPDQPAWRWL